MRNRVAWHFRQLESAQTRVLDARFQLKSSAAKAQRQDLSIRRSQTIAVQ